MCALVPPFRADDMNGLYKRVLKGQYPPIPSHYSMDMRQLIKQLLQVQPQSRPDTRETLDMPIVMKRYRKYFCKQDGSPMPIMELDENAVNVDLLRTIKL
jgi:NIMA (never in mitosis gene a)-related kinase